MNSITPWVGLALLLPGAAGAWEIDAPGASPCHERLVLGAFDVIEAPWSSPDDPPLDDVLAALVAQVDDEMSPGDAERAFVGEISRQFDLSDYDEPTRFVLASLVAGVRLPDTHGLASTRLNELREAHLAEENQPRHSLRRTSDDGPEGDATALAAAREEVETQIEVARVRWPDGRALERASWEVPHYGVQRVDVSGVAWRLGRAAHVVQDSHTHALRDEEGRVVTVFNYVEAVHRHRRFDPLDDGIAHSGRLDQCDPNDPDDAERFARARLDTIRLLRAALPAIRDDDDGPLLETLDGVFELRPGCTADNNYCDNPDLELALQGKPAIVSLCLCGYAEAPASGWVLLLMLVGVARARTRRARAERG